MTRSPAAFTCHRLAAIALGAAAFVVAACSGIGTSAIQPASGRANPATKAARPNAIATINFTFYRVTPSPSPGNNNRLTGINDNKEIVGDFGRLHTDFVAFTSNCFTSTLPSCYTKFPQHQYVGPGTKSIEFSTYLASLSSSDLQAGYMFPPSSYSNYKCGTCGLIRDASPPPSTQQWTVIQHKNQGSMTCGVTALQGIDDSRIAVGYYLSNGSPCASHAFEVYQELSNSWQYPAFNLLSIGLSNPIATGINGKGSTVGSGTLASSTAKVEGWYYRDTVYFPPLVAPIPGSVMLSKNTQPLAVNWEDHVVGWYLDNSSVTHGFVLFNPSGQVGTRVWQTVDAPSTLSPQPDGNLTVVSGINHCNDISGWYEYIKNGTKLYQGFVATSETCPTSHDRGGPTRNGASAFRFRVGGYLKGLPYPLKHESTATPVRAQ
jgi:hypothetical protein